MRPDAWECDISRAVVDIKCVAARVVASAPVFVDPFRGRPSATPGPDFQLHAVYVPRKRQIAVAGLDDLFPELRDMYEGDVVERIRNSGVSLGNGRSRQVASVAQVAQRAKSNDSACQRDAVAAAPQAGNGRVLRSTRHPIARWRATTSRASPAAGKRSESLM